MVRKSGTGIKHEGERRKGKRYKGRGGRGTLSGRLMSTGGFRVGCIVESAVRLSCKIHC